MRTIVDLPDDQVQALAEVCRREKISRAEAVRRAVTEYAKRHAAGGAEQAFGLWRGRRSTASPTSGASAGSGEACGPSSIPTSSSIT